VSAQGRWATAAESSIVGSLINGGFLMASQVRVSLLDHFVALSDPRQRNRGKRVVGA
jgi:hypothetical protein